MRTLSLIEKLQRLFRAGGHDNVMIAFQCFRQHAYISGFVVHDHDSGFHLKEVRSNRVVPIQLRWQV